MSIYDVTIIHAGGRALRTIIAHSSMRAVAIAIDTLPPSLSPSQFAIVCKPRSICPAA